MTYGDSRFIQILEAIEARDSMPTMANYNEGEKEMAHKLYAVLTSYLRGRCAHLAKAHSKTRDGLAVWYSLMREFEPSSGASSGFGVIPNISQRPILYGFHLDL